MPRWDNLKHIVFDALHWSSILLDVAIQESKSPIELRLRIIEVSLRKWYEAR